MPDFRFEWREYLEAGPGLMEFALVLGLTLHAFQSGDWSVLCSTNADLRGKVQGGMAGAKIAATREAVLLLRRGADALSGSCAAVDLPGTGGDVPPAFSDDFSTTGITEIRPADMPGTVSDFDSPDDIPIDILDELTDEERICPVCNGLGEDPRTDQACHTCNGTGLIPLGDSDESFCVEADDFVDHGRSRS